MSSAYKRTDNNSKTVARLKMEHALASSNSYDSPSDAQPRTPRMPLDEGWSITAAAVAEVSISAAAVAEGSTSAAAVAEGGISKVIGYRTLLALHSRNATRQPQLQLNCANH
jgi:hypothetical protein